MKPSKTFETKAAELFEAISVGKDSLVKAGKLVVELVQENENAFEILIERGMKESTLNMLHQIGKNPVYAELVLSDTYSSRKLLHLDSRDIDAAINRPLPLVIKVDGKQAPKIDHKRLDEMTRAEQDQVIAHGQIRTIEQQAEVLKERARLEAEKEMRFKVEGDVIRFLAGAVFKVAELADILERYKLTAMKTLQNEMRNSQLAK